MPSRMDKYNQNSRNISSRTTKNQQLYKELYSNKTYTEFTDIEKDNVIEINSIDNISSNNRRSDSNRTRMYYEAKQPDFKKNSLGINSSYQRLLDQDKEKTYNINDIMEFARKNRTNIGEEEKKRRIKSAEYSILSDLSQEKLKEYHDRKEKGLTKAEEENLEDLIHTITSKSLRKKIDDELLSDLLPQDESDTLISKNLLEEIENGKLDDIDDDTKEQIENTADLETGLDKSFYTRSMDLKREDLILKSDEEEVDNSFEDEKTNPVKVFIILLLILIVLGIIGFVLYKYLLMK